MRHEDLAKFVKILIRREREGESKVMEKKEWLVCNLSKSRTIISLLEAN